ncbi:MAG: UDP-N-acetylglucosamine--N-acetylmuramyl-(pentapeptide) pyrophosphoryl-undecaprenol N-acetylglucosamine transferase, partial [Thermoanaerobaculia bacterium]|nr:UDP-N-acetylglucosamine--N-acetylmuramyl-(pentapeptide) pyrophosphoryl-undecaprenol N-acetylglucosamine transferase [Thermoanaerobaculia bacterium]
RPTMIQEQNAFPGMTNRILAKFVDRIAVAFPRALEIFGRDGEVTGNPVRREFFKTVERRTMEGPVRILIFGGSQGSRVLNEAMKGALDHLEDLSGRIEIVHQTGPGDEEGVRARYLSSAFTGANVTPFIEDMAGAMARSDIVVCRAGAITVGELAAVGRAAILVPFALASDDHQEFNARSVEEGGGAIVLTEAELTPQRLADEIRELVTDAKRIDEMGKSAGRLGAPDATTRIVEMLEDAMKID